MSGIRLVHDDQASWRPPYAYAAMSPAGAALLFTAGACPLDEDGKVVSPGDAMAQARQVMINLRATLAAADASLSDVVKTVVYVATADRTTLVDVWKVVRSEFGDHDAPSTLVGVALLGWPDQLVEVEAVASVVPG